MVPCTREYSRPSRVQAAPWIGSCDPVCGILNVCVKILSLVGALVLMAASATETNRR